MRYQALACDYDGTLATGGIVPPSTVAALEELATGGRRLLLVTGRVLGDLEAIFPRLDLFSAIVAENGAVLFRPATREKRVLAAPPPASFVDRLRASVRLASLRRSHLMRCTTATECARAVSPPGAALRERLATRRISREKEPLRRWALPLPWPRVLKLPPGLGLASRQLWRCSVPKKKTVDAARKDAKEGKAPSTQAGEFVREEIHHVREGKHGARSAKQVIAIGLSKARRAGVKLPPPKKGASARTRRQAKRDSAKGARKPRSRPSRRRSRAVSRELEHEGRTAASHAALSRQAKESAGKRA